MFGNCSGNAPSGSGVVGFEPRPQVSDGAADESGLARLAQEGGRAQPLGVIERDGEVAVDGAADFVLVGLDVLVGHALCVESATRIGYCIPMAVGL
jgi:hypothetical protein